MSYVTFCPIIEESGIVELKKGELACEVLGCVDTSNNEDEVCPCAICDGPIVKEI